MVSTSRQCLGGKIPTPRGLIFVSLIWGVTVWQVFANTPTPTVTPTGPAPSPTGPTPTPIPTPDSWVTRTPCPSPPPTATPVCISDYRGPFYRAVDGETSLTVQITQPFRLELQVFHQADWCGGYVGSHFQYDPQVVELTDTIPEPYLYYDGPMYLYLRAVGAGATDIGVVYEMTPPEFVSLLQVTVEMTTPTATFTPVPTATPTATPVPTSPPQPSCTPAWRGPFYDCSTSYYEVEAGGTVSVILDVRDYNCGCCTLDPNPVFYYAGGVIRLLTRHTLEYCTPAQEEFVFQGLHLGTTNLTVYYNTYGWDQDVLTTIRVVPTPVPNLWMSH